jgi:hypothetical protein
MQLHSPFNEIYDEVRNEYKLFIRSSAHSSNDANPFATYRSSLIFEVLVILPECLD